MTKLAKQLGVYRNFTGRIVWHGTRGRVRNADFALLADGTVQWFAGTWLGGTWMNGWWWKGVWENGTWENGSWECGIWERGTWKRGYWRGGKIDGVGSLIHP